MRNPSAFCTLATGRVKYELDLLLYSLSVHHPGAPVFIYCDEETEKFIREYGLKIRVNRCLDKYAGWNKRMMDAENLLKDFFLIKTDVMRWALDQYPDVLFLDADQVVIAPIEVDESKKVGLSPQFITKKHTDRTGYYNGGMVWTSCKSMPGKWAIHGQASRFVDQAALEDIAFDYQGQYFEFGENHNLQCWRFRFGIDSPALIKSKTAIVGNSIYFKGEELTTIHTHFDELKFAHINAWFCRILKKAGRDDLIDKIRSMPSIVAKAVTI